MATAYYQPGPEQPAFSSGGQRVFLATPAYPGPVSAGYAKALHGTVWELARAGIPSELYILAEHCHVDDARNYCVRDFLRTTCTDLVFLDADVRWAPAELVRLLGYDRDVVGGAYRLKQEGMRYTVRFANEHLQAEPDGLLEVEHIATGFLRIRRAVLEKLAAEAPHYGAEQGQFGLPLFPLIFERGLAEDNVRVGGDFNFCRKWRAMGGRIYVDPELHFGHAGLHEWEGCLGAFLRTANGHTLRQVLTAILRNTATLELMQELWAWWGNEWALRPDQLDVLASMAREGEGPILELGSGISTLVMAAAAPHRTVHALESNRTWWSKLNKAIVDAGLYNVQLHRVGFKDYGSFEFYELPDALPEQATLLLIDGPARMDVAQGRAGASLVFDRLAPGAMIFADDARLVADVLPEWEAKLGQCFRIVGETKKFAVMRMPGEAPQAGERGSAA